MHDPAPLHVVRNDDGIPRDIAAVLRGLVISAPIPETDDSFFESVAGPHLLDAMDCARVGDLQSVRAADECFMEAVPVEERPASLLAGTELIEALGTAKHVRFARRIAEEGPVHFATAYALRCVAFNHAPFASLAAFRVLGEMGVEGTGRRGITVERVRRVLEDHPAIASTAGRLLEAIGGGNHQLHCA